MNERVSYQFIASQSALEQAAAILGEARMMAVDLEADSMYHYREKVCLLQIATETMNLVVDPLALPDLAPLRAIFADPAVRKIFHGADYDIRSLFRDFAFEVNHIFDTQLACRFLGLKETGLEAVLRSRFGAVLDKRFQKKDWSERPLAAEMLEYGIVDVVHLIPLARELERELAEKNRLAWVEEECAALSRVRPGPLNRGPYFPRVKGADRLDRRSLAVLEALLQVRNGRAEKVDRPPFKVIGNDPLLQLAALKPATLADLEGAKLLSPKQMASLGPIFVEEIAKALALPEAELPVYPRGSIPRLSSGEKKRVKDLKEWRDQRAKELELEPSTLFNNANLTSLAGARPRNRQELEEVAGLKRWQKEAFSWDVLAVLNRPEEGLLI
jgi:ribonuclease D